MSEEPTEGSGVRIAVLGLIVFSMFATLFVRLWSLQVLRVEDHEVAAIENRFETLPVRAPRGRILDRNGKVLVDNRVSVVVTLDPQVLDAEFDDPADRSRYIGRLARELSSFGIEITATEINARLADSQYSPLAPRPVAEDVPESVEIFLGERRDDYPAVAVERRTVRTYPYGQLAAHVLGYVGALNEEEYDSQERADSEKPYEVDDEIGKTGVERVFESWLRGTPGERVVQVDSANRVVADVTSESVDPAPGDDVRLTIDIDLQAAAEKALEEKLVERREVTNTAGLLFPAPAGAVVMLDPRDGDLLAVASNPTYDPVEFLGGISQERFDLLNSEENGAPLFSRAIQGTYAPASTFKLVTAFAALESGMITPETTFEDVGTYTLTDCTGSSCTRSNAEGAANGTVDLQRSLTVSSDVFYYWIGESLWRQESLPANGIQDTARLFGFGEETGVPLPEASGTVPTPEERQAQKDEIEAADPDAYIPGWRAGDNVNLAIGQGDVLVTPLQLTNAYAIIANGGTRFQPNIADAVVDIDRRTGEQTVVQEFGPREAASLELPAAFRDPILDGLNGVTTDEEGTAFYAFEGFDPTWSVAGKTGTAQVVNKEDTSLFVGFGPVETPRVVVTAVLEEAGFGSEAAAPVVRRLLELVSEQRELPTYPTISEVDDPQAVYDELWEQLWNPETADESESSGSGHDPVGEDGP